MSLASFGQRDGHRDHECRCDCFESCAICAPPEPLRDRIARLMSEIAKPRTFAEIPPDMPPMSPDGAVIPSPFNKPKGSA